MKPAGARRKIRRMVVGGFDFSFVDYPEFRLIRAELPTQVTADGLSTVVWQFLEIYESELPFAVLSDYSKVRSFAEPAIPVLKAVLERSFCDERLLAATWITGGNDAMRDMVRRLLVEVGRSPDLVVATRGEAIAVLRAAGVGVPDDI